MKTLAALIRHAVTYLVGLLVAWFTLHLTTPEDLKVVVDAATSLVEPLVILAGFAAVILARLAMPVLNKIFRRGAGEGSGGASGGMVLLVLWLGLSMTVVGTLPSCVPGAEYPVTGSLAYTDPATGAQVGLAVGSPQAAKKPKRAKITVVTPDK